MPGTPDALLAAEDVEFDEEASGIGLWFTAPVSGPCYLAVPDTGNLLPAVGFGLLLTMIMDKKVAAWFFIGFILTAYLGMPTIAVTLLATAAVVLLLFAREDKPALSTAAEEDDNEF